MRCPFNLNIFFENGTLYNLMRPVNFYLKELAHSHSDISFTSFFFPILAMFTDSFLYCSSLILLRFCVYKLNPSRVTILLNQILH